MTELEEKLVKEQEEYAAFKQRQLADDLVFMLSSDPGRRVWLWIANDLCGLNKRMPVGQNLERTEGRRDVAVDMAEALQPYPELGLGIEVLRSKEAAEEFKFVARMNQLDALRRQK